MKLDASRSTLLLIDFQQRLTPAIDGADAAVANAHRLAKGAELLGVPFLVTEQYPKGLGPTVDALAAFAIEPFVKTTFDATRTAGFLDRLPTDRTLILAGCEAHICVLQTALGLIAAGRSVAIVADAVGSRTADNRRLGLSRAEKAGAEIVTTEMVLFEWLGDAGHPQFKAVSALVK
jgi:nicotinamidase-related amidase